MSQPAVVEAAGAEGEGARGQRRQERERQKSDEEQRARDQDSDSDDSDAELLRNMANLEVIEKGPAKHKGTGFIYDELFTKHKCEWDSSYPECPERVTGPFQRCQELGLVARCQQIALNYATEDQIQWHHSLGHLERGKESAVMTPAQRQQLAKGYDSWYANEATFEVSLAAAGSTIQLMDQILQSKVTNGFAMVRPPGHHAMENEFNGYCTFNNVALATTHALNSGIERILIVDWDVHHGQGTQQMFYEDPRVMYFSIHRYENGAFWPNLRESDYDFIGEGKGKGFNVNVPLNKTGLGDSDFMAIFHQLLLPLAYEFRPQVVVVSCGLDAAIGDEKGEMLVTPAAYAHFIHHLSALCEGRLCTVLEGGYCLQSLAEGCAMTLRSLLTDPCPQLPPLAEPSDSIISSILNAIKVLRLHWRCFDILETLEPGELCPFDEVNTSPPKEGIKFSTAENRPAEFEIQHNYPQQSVEIRERVRQEIDRLVAETSLTKAPHRTCFVFDTAMRKHKNPFDTEFHGYEAVFANHPERPKRISCIFEKHREWGLLNRCLMLESRDATDEEILTVHRADYLEAMKESVDLSDEQLRFRPREQRYNSVYMCQDTYSCALLAAGSVLEVTDAVLSGKAQSGVAVVRPPGHHAECSGAMGFCFFNNVAMAAAYAKNKFGLKRVLIVDWDVHHGNATQHMFYDDPSVLYISLHRYEHGSFFPGSPDAGHTCVGKDAGRGFNVNIPWSKEKMGNAEYMTAFQKIVMPIAYEFGPELVLVSAGFDAAAGDYLGGFRVMPDCYGHMTHMLSGLANGKVVLALEGGYNATAIALSMATCTSVLLGDPCPPMQLSAPNDSAKETMREVLEVQKEFWKSLKFAVKLPMTEDEYAAMSIGPDFPVSGQYTWASVDEKPEIKPSPNPEGGDQVTVLPSSTEKKMAETHGSSESRGSLGEVVTATGNLSLGAGSEPAADNVKVASGQTGGSGLAPPTAAAAPGGMEGGPSAETAGAEGGGEEGATGGAWRPNTMADVLKMQGYDQLYAVQPLSHCPHLPSVRELPPGGLDTEKPCQDCGDTSENWVCLVCYGVFCSRYVSEHMLFHGVAEGHLMALSFSDLSVWCYACNDYVDNRVTFPMKNAAHCHKFGEPLTNPWMLE